MYVCMYLLQYDITLRCVQCLNVYRYYVQGQRSLSAHL